MKVAILIVGLVLLGLLVSTVLRGGEDLKVGDVAPDFALQGSDGKVHKLAELRGRTVVLAWFPKAFTGGWTAECKSLRESAQTIRGFDAVLFAASTDDAETNRKFAESLELTIPILSDPEKKVSGAYGVLRMGFAARHTFYIGPDGKLLYIDREVNPKTAGEDVARRLAALGVAPAKKG